MLGKEYTKNVREGIHYAIILPVVFTTALNAATPAFAQEQVHSNQSSEIYCSNSAKKFEYLRIAYNALQRLISAERWENSEFLPDYAKDKERRKLAEKEYAEAKMRLNKFLRELGKEPLDLEDIVKSDAFFKFSGILREAEEAGCNTDNWDTRLE